MTIVFSLTFLAFLFNFRLVWILFLFNIFNLLLYSHYALQ